MELSKEDKRLAKDIIRRGILHRHARWQEQLRSLKKILCALSSILLMMGTSSAVAQASSQAIEVKANQPESDTEEGSVFTALFIGDSITDGGWGRSGGSAMPSSKRNKTDQNHALGHSYVMLSAAKMMADDPKLKCNWMNRGISGNTVTDLKNRWQEDVIAEQPDLLTVMVGVNDVFSYYGKEGAEKFDVEAWSAEFRELLREATKANPSLKIILMSPFVAEGRSVKHDIFLKIKKSIDECAASVEAIAKEFNAEYIDTNSLFNSLTTNNPDSARWLWDGIHPTPAGHQLIANLWTKTATPYIYPSK